MIRIFRKIRQSHITDKKFSKYLLFAIAEIILVVTGILVALYIDNDNEKTIRNELFNISLDQIYTNLKCDLDVAVWDLERVKEQEEVCGALLRNQPELDELQLLEILYFLDWCPGTGFLVSNFDYYIEQLKYAPQETSKSSLVFHISAFYNLMHNGFAGDYNLAKVRFFSPVLTKHKIPVAGKINVPNILGDDSSKQPLYYSQEILENLKQLSTKEEYYTALVSTNNRILRLKDLIQFRIGEIESLMSMIKGHEPNVQFRFDQIRIIGSGLNHEEGALEIMTYNEQNSTWSIKSTFRKGGIKFSSSYATYLTWGMDKNHTEAVKFWGEEIPVEDGVYIITLNLTDMEYKLVKE